jgi:hypothetical protein
MAKKIKYKSGNRFGKKINFSDCGKDMFLFEISEIYIFY